MDVLEVCPMLVPQNSKATIYDGIIKVAGECFQLRLELREPGSLRGLQLNCDWRLHQLLAGYQQLLQQRIQQCSGLSAFLLELKSIIEKCVEGGQFKKQQPPPPVYYRDLLQQIETLGWHRVAYIDASFQQLHLVATDQHNRQHTLRIHLHGQSSEAPPECSTDLPQVFDFTWNKKSTLSELYSQFEQSLQKYQDLWDQLDELDSATWILEPEKPTRGATYRRIALGSNASVQIELDSKHPRLLPECRFMGADHVVNPLKENLNNNRDKWKPQSTVVDNLQTVLAVQLPSPATSKKEDFSMECGICYTYRLDGYIPDQVCEEKRCAQPFHSNCLYEWLRALPTSKTSFNLVFGECPYCNKRMTVKMAAH